MKNNENTTGVVTFRMALGEIKAIDSHTGSGGRSGFIRDALLEKIAREEAKNGEKAH